MLCDDKMKCYLPSQRCDNIRQCDDGSDERNCGRCSSPAPVKPELSSLCICVDLGWMLTRPLDEIMYLLSNQSIFLDELDELLHISASVDVTFI